jgi:hypothetical protein
MPIRKRIKGFFHRDKDPVAGSSRASTPDQSSSTSANLHGSESSPALIVHTPIFSSSLPNTISSPGLPATTDRTNRPAEPGKVPPSSYTTPNATLSVSTSSVAPPPSTVQTATKTAWSGLKTFLGLLNESADAFGPLKSAVGGINRCSEIYDVFIETLISYPHT